MFKKSLHRSEMLLLELPSFSLARLETPSKVVSSLPCPLLNGRFTAAGNVVTRLEYQAYSKLAIKTMANIVQAAVANGSRSDHHTSTQPASPLRCSVHHRLGTVPVGEPSIVIAVSSPHRKEAFIACEYILEEIKRKAQIWKREYYEGKDEAEAEWKENS